MEISHRDTLPPDVLHELDSYTAKLNGFAYAEHNQDGSHSDVTADTISLQGAQAGVVYDLPYDASRYKSGGSGTWTVSQIAAVALKYARVGQVVTVSFVLEGTVISVDTPTDGLFIRLPEFAAIPIRGSAGVKYASGTGSGRYENVTEGVNGFLGVAVEAFDYSGVTPYTAIDLFAMTVTFAALPVTINFYGSATFFVQPNNVAVPYYGS